MKDILNKLKVKLVLFDVDDTLIQTHSIFLMYIDNVIKRLAEEVNCEIYDFAENYNKCHFDARTIHHVDPTTVWDYTLDLLIEKFPNISLESKNWALEELSKIYTHNIPLKEGVIELLETLISEGFQIGIVTNASPEWTALKLENAGLAKYFSIENEYAIVPPNVRKVREHWEKAIQIHQLQPTDVMIIGDNFNADVKPGIELGAISVYITENPINEISDSYKGKFIKF